MKTAILVFLLGLIAMSALTQPAHATGSGPTTPMPPSGNSNDDTTRDFALGAITVAALLCVAPSAWHLLKTGKWEWCWEDTKPEPLPDPGPAVKNNNDRW